MITQLFRWQRLGLAPMSSSWPSASAAAAVKEGDAAAGERCNRHT
jgi:hypothetical protein